MFISEFNLLMLAFITMYFYLSQIVKITQWGLLVTISILLIISLAQTTNIFTFYLIFELFNILVYILIGFNSVKLNDFKASIIYFLVGFMGSITLLYGIYVIFNPILSNQIGFSLIFIALLLKIGAFPFSH